MFSRLFGGAVRAGVMSLAAFAAVSAADASAGTIDVSHVPQTTKASALPADWNKSAAFMEIFVRSYADSDGDGVGDIKGLTSRLDYLQSLGVTGLWLMPIGPSADGDHGYAVNDYRAINPDYGTLRDFDTLVAEAHKRGIGIILDFVINHSGSGNPIFRDAAASRSSAYRDWYLFSDQNPGWYDAKIRGQNGAYWNDPWIAADKTVPGGQGLYYGVFSTQMPDWNLKNPRVVDYLGDSMRFWMNRGVDGFRLDAVTMLIEDGPTSYFNNPANPGIVAKLSAVVKAYDNRYMICEASEKPEMYTASCDAFAYGTQGFIEDSARKGAVQAGLITQLQSPGRDAMPLALQSHDAYVGDRLINQFGVNGTTDYKLSAAMAILAARTPFSYYGEEIGMSNGGVYNDPGLRSPMSWTGVKTTAGFTMGKPYRDVAINVASNNVEAETGDPQSLLEYYRALYTVRKAHPVLGTGAFRLMSEAGEPVLAFSRTGPSDQAVVAINVSGAEQAVSLDAGKPDTAFVNAMRVKGEVAPAAVRSDGSGRLRIVVPAKSAVVMTPEN